jgi:hypothetical protein
VRPHGVLAESAPSFVKTRVGSDGKQCE